MDFPNEDWQRKGATLSDKTARAEFGLTQDEIIAAIRAGKLQYRLSSMHGTRGCGSFAGKSRISSAPGMARHTSGSGRHEPSSHALTAS